MNANRITDNKNFWRVVNPNFLKKIIATDRVIFKDCGIIKSDTEKVSDNFNKFLVNMGNTLKIDKNKRFPVETDGVFDLI